MNKILNNYMSCNDDLVKNKIFGVSIKRVITTLERIGYPIDIRACVSDRSTRLAVATKLNQIASGCNHDYVWTMEKQSFNNITSMEDMGLWLHQNGLGKNNTINIADIISKQISDNLQDIHEWKSPIDEKIYNAYRLGTPMEINIGSPYISEEDLSKVGINNYVNEDRVSEYVHYWKNKLILSAELYTYGQTNPVTPLSFKQDYYSRYGITVIDDQIMKSMGNLLMFIGYGLRNNDFKYDLGKVEYVDQSLQQSAFVFNGDIYENKSISFLDLSAFTILKKHLNAPFMRFGSSDYRDIAESTKRLVEAIIVDLIDQIRPGCDIDSKTMVDAVVCDEMISMLIAPLVTASHKTIGGDEVDPSVLSKLIKLAIHKLQDDVIKSYLDVSDPLARLTPDDLGKSNDVSKAVNTYRLIRIVHTALYYGYGYDIPPVAEFCTKDKQGIILFFDMMAKIGDRKAHIKTDNQSVQKIYDHNREKLELMTGIEMEDYEDISESFTQSELEEYVSITPEVIDLEAAFTILNKKVPKLKLFDNIKMISDPRIDDDLLKAIHDLRNEWVKGNGPTSGTMSPLQVKSLKKVESILKEVFNFKSVSLSMAEPSVNAATVLYTYTSVGKDVYTEDEIKAGVISVTSKAIRFKEAKIPMLGFFNRGLLASALISDREALSIELHEVGHQFEVYSDYENYIDSIKRTKIVYTAATIQSTIMLLPAIVLTSVAQLAQGNILGALLSFNSVMSGYISNILLLYINSGGQNENINRAPDKIYAEMDKTKEEFTQQAKKLYDLRDKKQYQEYIFFLKMYQVLMIYGATISGVINWIMRHTIGPVGIALGTFIQMMIIPGAIAQWWSMQISGKDHKRKEYGSDFMATAYGYGPDITMALTKMTHQDYYTNVNPDQFKQLIRKIPVLRELDALTQDTTTYLNRFVMGGTVHPDVRQRHNAIVDMLNKMKADHSDDKELCKRIDEDLEAMEFNLSVLKVSEHKIYNPFGHNIKDPKVIKQAERIKLHAAEEIAPKIATQIYGNLGKKTKEPDRKKVVKGLLKSMKQANFVGIGEDLNFNLSNIIQDAKAQFGESEEFAKLQQLSNIGSKKFGVKRVKSNIADDLFDRYLSKSLKDTNFPSWEEFMKKEYK